MNYLEKKINDVRNVKVADNFYYNDLAVMVAFSYVTPEYFNSLEFKEGLTKETPKSFTDVFENFEKSMDEDKTDAGVNPKMVLGYLNEKGIIQSKSEEEIDKLVELLEQDHYLIENQDYDGFAYSSEYLSFGYSSMDKAKEIINNYEKFKSPEVDSKLFFDFNKFHAENYNSYTDWTEEFE